MWINNLYLAHFTYVCFQNALNFAYYAQVGRQAEIVLILNSLCLFLIFNDPRSFPFIFNALNSKRSSSLLF